MSKKRSKKKKATTSTQPVTKTDTRGVNYEDPCHHCRYVSLTSRGWACRKNCEAFMNTPQGFDIDPLTELATILCKHFSHLPKPLRPSLI